MTHKSDINQVPLTSPDERAMRLDALRRLFPDLFDGEGVLDEKELRTLLSNDSVIVGERFRFEWAGKQQSKQFAFAPSKATLLYDWTRSINADGTNVAKDSDCEASTSGNLIIEGDNLEVLKLLSRSYFERVKCIYIDPPYNTGKDFIYPDDFSETREVYWAKAGYEKAGTRLVALSENSGRRHSSWLNMMQARLYLSRNLLKDDGVIFISIDDREVHNLRKLCDEVFGEDNFITQLVWHKKYTRSNDALYFSDNHDHILVYAKNKAKGVINDLPRSEKSNDAYTNPDNHKKGVWKATPLHAKSGSEGEFSYTFKNGVTWMPPKGTFARFAKDTMKALDEADEIYFGLDGDAVPQRKSFLTEVKDGLTPVTILPYSEVGHTHESNDELKALELEGVFQNPKPTRLIERFIDLAIPMGKNEIILDFFGGSGTTAHAAMKANFSQDRNIQFILVQIPEVIDEGTEAYNSGFRLISDITIERTKRAGKALASAHAGMTKDIGFRVFRLGQSAFPTNTFNPDPAKSEAENLSALDDHLTRASQKTMFTADNLSMVVSEIALKFGFGLFFKTASMTAEYPNNNVLSITGNGKSAILCLDSELKDATVETLKTHSEEQLIVAMSALDTTRKFELHNAFNDNLWSV